MNMDLLELITTENIHELQPGEWIWDNRDVYRNGHTYEVFHMAFKERVGFRKIMLLNLKDFGTFTDKPFMLSTIDSYHTNKQWIRFEENRFYRFKKE